MAEARIAVAEPRVHTVEEIAAPQSWKEVLTSFRSTATKRYYKVRFVFLVFIFSDKCYYMQIRDTACNSIYAFFLN